MGRDASDIIDDIKRFSEMDHGFSTGRVLGSMYTTPLDVAVRAHTMFMEANLGNRGLYPGTEAMESTVKRYIGNVIGVPQEGDIFLTSGGTEANISAVWMARNMFKYRKLYMAKSAHFSIRKAADILGLETVLIELDDSYRLDVSDLEAKMDTPGVVVATAGTTELGQIDPVEEIAPLTAERGGFLHVDAAFGGLVIPHLEAAGELKIRFSYDVEGVESVATDPHKMLMSTIPLGALSVRNASYLDSIRFHTPYLTTEYQYGLLGTRASGAVAGAYAAIEYLGDGGLSRVIGQCMENTRYFLSRIREAGLEAAIEPAMNILAVRFRKPCRVYDWLLKRGWYTSISTHPPGLRFVVMPHVTREVIDEFVPVLKEAVRETGEGWP